MNDAKIFDDYIAARGGRLPRERLPLDSQRTYNQFAEQAQTLIDSAKSFLPRLPEIYFDFVHDESINAYAFKTAGKYYIGLTTGAIYMLNLILTRMLADSRLFQGLGDSENEREDLPIIEKYVPRAEQMYQSGIVPTLPITAGRKAYAFFIRDQALMFLVGHEIAHIAQGHVDYLAYNAGSAFLMELGWNSPDPNVVLERQCLEILADSRSIWSRIHSLKLSFESPVRPVPTWSSEREDKGILLFHWSVAVNVLFRLFGDERFNVSKLSMASYPPLPLRRVLAGASTTGAVVEGWDPALKPVVQLAFRRGLNHVEEAFAVILGQEKSLGNLLSVFSQEGKEHIALLDTLSQSLKSRLEPYAF